MWVLGIDPGKKGALALFCPALSFLRIWDVPVSTRTTGSGRVMTTVDNTALQKIAEEIAWIGPPSVAVVEKVGARPGEAPSYAFDFGRTTGALEQVVASIVGCELRHVAPAVWKGRLGVPAEKKAALARATALLPAHAHLWPLVKHDGRAEAALLAHYGVSQWGA